MRKYLSAVVLPVLAWPAACFAAPTPDQFAADMLARFQAAEPDGDFSVSADEPLVIKASEGNGGEPAQINLHRIYGYCLNASAEDCEATKAEFAQKTLSGAPDVKSGALRIIVRDKAYLDYALGVWSDGKPHVLYRHLGADLYALLAFDGPDSIGLTTVDQLKSLGLREEAAWPLAMQQTKAVLPEIPSDILAKHQAVAFEEHELLGSLLADLEIWKGISATAGPDLFVTVTSDGFVFAAFMPDGPDLTKFSKTVREDCDMAPRCISPHIYRFRAGKWEIASGT